MVYLRHLPSVYAPHAYTLEMFREFTTLLVVGVVAWLIASSWSVRARAFCFAFGAWDIVYYVALWKFTGFPALTDDDVLFLIPIPWTAPVWAPVSFAFVLMLVGLFGVAPRRSVLLALAFVLALCSFVYRAALHSDAYPLWLFTIAFILALAALPVERNYDALRKRT